MHSRHLPILLILISMFAPGARALSIVENSPYRTVEWFVADSDLIVRGVVKDVLEQEISRGNTFATVTLAVNETYKGNAVPASATITFTARNSDARVWRESGKKGGEYLFFLVKSDAHVASRPEAAKLAAGWSAAPYAMRDYYAVAPISMTARPDQRLFAFTDGVRSFETAQEVIEVVKTEVRRGSAEYRGEFTIDFSGRSDMLKRVPATKEGALGVYYHLTRLIIPLDRRAEAHAQRWVKSADPTDRYNAARILAEFRSDQNVALLKGLLGDTFTADDFWPRSYSTFNLIVADRPHKWKETRRPIRQFAWHALKQWGVAPPDAELGKPLYAANHLRRWQVLTPAVVVIALLVFVILRGWRESRTRRPRLFAGVGGASFLLLLVAAGLWIRSRSHIDEMALRTGRDARIEVALLPGGVRAMSFEGWVDPFPLAFTTVRRSPTTEQDWLHHDNVKPVPGRTGRAGFYRDTGTIAGPGQGRGVAYRAWTIPYWSILTAFSLPVVWRIGKVIKKWRQFGQGLCPRCGYDLRATPDRCPECGSVFVHETSDQGLSRRYRSSAGCAAVPPARNGTFAP